jgi:hypothetical protein
VYWFIMLQMYVKNRLITTFKTKKKLISLINEILIISLESFYNRN